MRDSRGRSMPEIAVAGRSNVGKSSLLNDLFQAKGLVKTSSTPGKTQAINFFTLNGQLSFVDLPGYGYAQVASHVKKTWGPMVENYLNQRESLQLMLFLIDIRRTPNDEDFQMMEWICNKQLPAILILTKVDKVTQSEREHQTSLIENAFEKNAFSSSHLVPRIHYSTLKHEGRKQLIQAIVSCLN